MRAYTLPPVQFAFRDDQSRSDKLRGLVDFGPYRDLKSTPTFGFVFPVEFRDFANNLVAAPTLGAKPFTGKPLRPNQMAFTQNFPKWHTSLMKAWYGNAATKENDFAYDWLPKRDAAYDALAIFERMHQGKVNGFLCQWFNPLAWWGRRALRDDQELACERRPVRQLAGIADATPGGDDDVRLGDVDVAEGLFDELQDLDEAAMLVLRRLVAGGNGVFVGAGDFNQHILPQLRVP